MLNLAEAIRPSEAGLDWDIAINVGELLRDLVVDLPAKDTVLFFLGSEAEWHRRE